MQAGLRRCKDAQLPRLAAETYGFLCTHQELYTQIVDLGIIEGIITLAQYRDSELHFWAAALLLNLVGVSDTSKAQMVQCGAIHLLSDLVCAPRREVGEMATKALVVLAMWCADTAAVIIDTSVKPLLECVMDLDTKTTCHNPLLTRLALFTRCTEVKAAIVDADEGQVLMRICTLIDEFLSLSPWNTPNLEEGRLIMLATASNCTDSSYLLVMLVEDTAVSKALLESHPACVKAAVGALCGVLRPLFLVQDFLHKTISKRGGEAPLLGLTQFNGTSRPKPYRLAAQQSTADEIVRNRQITHPDKLTLLRGSVTPRRNPDLSSAFMSPADNTATFMSPHTDPTPMVTDIERRSRSAYRHPSSRPSRFMVSPQAPFSSPRRTQSLGSRTSLFDQPNPRFSIPVETAVTPAQPPETPTMRHRASEFNSPRRGESLPSASGRHPDVFSPRTRWLSSGGSRPDVAYANTPRASNLSSVSGFMHDGRPRTAPEDSPPRRRRDINGSLHPVIEEDGSISPPRGARASDWGTPRRLDSSGYQEAPVRVRSQSLPSPPVHTLRGRHDSNVMSFPDHTMDDDDDDDLAFHPPQNEADSVAREHSINDSPANRPDSQLTEGPFTSTPRARSRARASAARMRDRRGSGPGNPTRSNLFAATSLNEDDSALDEPRPLSDTESEDDDDDEDGNSDSRKLNLSMTTAEFRDSIAGNISMHADESLDVSFQTTAEELSGVGDLSFVSNITLEISRCSFAGDDEDGNSASRTPLHLSMAAEDDLIDEATAAVDLPNESSDAVRVNPRAPAPVIYARGHTDRPVETRESAGLAHAGAIEQRRGSKGEAGDAGGVGGALDPAQVLLEGEEGESYGQTHKQHMLRTFKEVAEQMIAFTSLLTRCKADKSALALPHLAGSAVWATIYACPSPKVVFHAVAALTRLSCPLDMLNLKTTRAEIDVEKSTLRLSTTPDRLGARNDSWGFESARANKAAAGGGLFYYEAVVMSKGIVQIGWASSSCTAPF